MYARITITDEITGEFICTAKVGLTEDWGHLFFDIDTQAALDAACLEAGRPAGDWQWQDATAVIPGKQPQSMVLYSYHGIVCVLYSEYIPHVEARQAA